MTVNELDVRMDALRGEIRTGSDALLALTGDPSATMEAIRSKKTEVADLRERLAAMEEEKANMEAAHRANHGGSGAAITKREAAGMFYRASLTGTDVNALPQMAYEQLGIIPANNADQGHGSKLLPTQLSNELLLEPLEKNPLRDYMTVTQITGLVLPKLTFSIEDDDFAAKDGETAKELALDADDIEFGRHKLHVIAPVSETVLRSSPLAIEAVVHDGLSSAQTVKELKSIFAASPKTGEEGMSLYAVDATSKKSIIKEVEGATLFDAITAAYGDLEDAYRAGARVCMRFIDYIGMIRDMANSEALFTAKPETVLGIPTIFCDRATTPIVGNFKYLHLNFDCAPWYDTGKDIKTGNRLFDCTELYDIKIKMKSAFRLVKVTEATAPSGGSGT